MRIPPRIKLSAAGAALLALSIFVIVPTTAAAPPTSRGASRDYVVDYLVSDGEIPSEQLDLELKNGWGLAASAAGPWWVNVEEMDLAKVYSGDGVVQDLEVEVTGGPTGIVSYAGDGFIVTDGTTSGPARFLFATLSGTIAAWNPTVGPAPPAGEAFVVLDESAEGAVYTGLAVAQTDSGARLYTADFHNATVEVYDEAFEEVELDDGAFTDPRLPAGYAPFGIQALAGKIFVAYAKVDPATGEEKAGRGLGIVDVYDTDGTFIARVGAHAALNAPWGMAIAPADFGAASGNLLVSNFGDGTIAVFKMSADMSRFMPAGVLRDTSHKPIKIDGIWGIAFGNNATAGPSNALYFAAGPEDEEHGSFGRILPATTTPR
jgi:uncharacterized protein (TIGR03118 family)